MKIINLKPRIPFGSLVELGILKPGTVLFDPKKNLTLKSWLMVALNLKKSEGSIHKVAAKILWVPKVVMVGLTGTVILEDLHDFD